MSFFVNRNSLPCENIKTSCFYDENVTDHLQNLTINNKTTYIYNKNITYYSKLDHLQNLAINNKIPSPEFKYVVESVTTTQVSCVPNKKKRIFLFNIRYFKL